MKAKYDKRVFSALAGFMLLAMVAGLSVSLLEPVWAIAGALGAATVLLVLWDYRVGVIGLTCLFPWAWSPYLPQASGFDLINFLVLASAVSLSLRRMFGKELTVVLPRVVVWCYLLPILIGTLVAWPHLSQGAANFPAALVGQPSVFAPDQYLKTKIIKPLFFVAYAFLVANAVRDSKTPELFLVPFGLSAMLPAFAIMIVSTGSSVGVEDRDGYLRGLGMHSNSYGMLLALAAGPLLFLTVGKGSIPTRVASSTALVTVSVGLVLTGSRGAALAYAIAIAMWLLRRRKATDLVLIALVALALLFAVPDKVLERMTLGLDEIGSTRVDSSTDNLTKGRLAGWIILAPEILDSPVWGQGVGSVAWNAATTRGSYRALLSHNVYLDMLLDVGIIGFSALVYLQFWFARRFNVLSRDKSLSPVLRDFFSGCFISFLGMLAMLITNGWWIPHPEQTFLWFSLGFAFAYSGRVLNPRDECNVLQKSSNTN